MFVNNETWANTINVSSNITIPSGKRLVINPDVLVYFTNNTQLGVSGTLTANGTASQRITFRSYGTTPGSWKYIQFSSGSSGSVKYCDILYANKGIYVYNVSPTIQNNNIRYFTEQGIYLTGASANPDIQYNTITNGGVQGIYVYGPRPSSTPTIQNNTIGAFGSTMTYGFERYYGSSNAVELKNNAILRTSSSGAAIKVSSAPLKVINNTITNNSGHGIWVKSGGNPDIHDNNINLNVKTGIYVEQGTPTNIKWNNIQGNIVNGIHFLSTCDDTYFTTVLQNKWNNIYDNEFYDLNNQKTTLLLAENQFWNSNDGNQIDDKVNGNVDFTPWKTIANPDAGPGGAIGKILAEEPLSIEEQALPTEFSLGASFPNPFNPETTFNYALPTEAKVTVKIFNILGEEVTTLLEQQQPGGSYRLVWNGKNSSGVAVPSGVYFYRLEAQVADETFAKYMATNKMLLIK